MRTRHHTLETALLAAIEQSQQQINTGLEQISSGRRVNVPSDDPAAASVLVRTADQSAETDQFLYSLGSIEGSMQNADSALASACRSAMASSRRMAVPSRSRMHRVAALVSWCACHPAAEARTR